MHPEAVVDKAIYNGGPILIALAICLIGECTVAFYTVILPYHWLGSPLAGHHFPLAPVQNPRFLTFVNLLHLAFTLLVVCNIAFNYAMAIRTNPGVPLAVLEEGVEKRCKKCGGPKPERTHHCSVCNRCIQRFDHHCPWIHNCVGHHNHRYFIVFMVYLCFAAIYFVVLGFGPFFLALDFVGSSWPYLFSRSLYCFNLVLACAMALAVGTMGGWHVYLTLTGQTTVEFYENSYDKEVAKEHGEMFVNPYDLGVKANLRTFLNVCDAYPWWYVLLPIPVPPKGDGKTWDRRAVPSRHRGLSSGLYPPPLARV
ncbi:hypothetical protein BZG36_00672 [Bifiguratus adelaidae]|uniref:Palmitoyltransferase n=1 Tax=Bifiguratus adelaidae TaxID=1938954 RepID=A0A261Y7C7_9FUNG|nr:hypothetical protein BZG36_00672 [Bifiguratus adelaidae]